MTDLVEKQN